MKVQEKRLQAARDSIAVEQREAVAARDQLQAQRAEFLATRDMREQRIAALQERAGTIEGNLPDLSVDPASRSAPSAPAPVSGQTAVLGPDGLAAAPAGAPQAVKDVIAAANAIVGMPYLWGGGHGSFESSGYDCSGAVSYALNGGGLISSPLDSTGLTTWGEPGEGNWITVYGNSGHVYAVIAGLRWDTSDTGGTGPKWHSDLRDNVGFIPRHPAGL
jgi:cell wall-associated NlpC family hydrolase